MNKLKKIFSGKIFLGIALSSALIITTSIGTLVYAAPYSYVSLDVNPSITYKLNRFNRVISIIAVNDDGQEIIDNMNDVIYMTIEEAIAETVDMISLEGYLSTKSDAEDDAENDAENNTENDTENNTENDTENNTENDTENDEFIQGGIVITVSNKDLEISQELSDVLEVTLKELVGENVEIEVSSIGLDRVKEAEELGVSPGKLNLVEKLKASSTELEDIDTEEWLDKSVKDIMNAINGNDIASKDAIEEAKEQEREAEEEAKEQAREAEEEAKEQEREAEEEAKEQASEDEEEAKEQAREVEKETKEQVREAEKDAKEQTKEAEKDAKEQAREAEKNVKEQAREAKKDAEEQAREAEEDAEEDAKEQERETEKKNEKEREAELKAAKKAREVEIKAAEKAREAEKKAAEKDSEAENNDD